jgi:LuxR family maltose regulon positive regulatory protein
MTSDTADAELVLKCTPPRVSRDQLQRARLGWDSEGLLNKSIIEVVAPAGFGKTSLLGQWRREALALGALAAWLTLDERDDVARFSAALAYSMRIASGRPTFERAVAHTMRQGGSALEGLTAWLAEIANLGAETVLILDEVQAVSANVLESLLYLILNAPPNLRVVLASRRALQLPLSSFLARGLYAELGVERLRFTRQETTEILKARFKDRVDAESCLRLHEKAAGWPLGLQLAMVVIERQSDLNAAIATMDAASGSLERYFLEGLLNDLEPRVVDFLVRISMLDALRTDLCAFVADDADAAGLLDRLRDTLPIFVAGSTDEWVRLHPMVREFLLGQLGKRPDEARRALHARAAQWLAEHGWRELAADQALAAGQEAFAHALMSECMYAAALRGDSVRLLYWLDRIPPGELERHPRTLIGAAWVLALSERHQEAARLIAKIRDDAATPVEERFESALIGAAAAYFADRIDEMANKLAPWKDHEPSSSPTLCAIHANCVAIAQIYRGNPEQARRVIRAAHVAIPHRGVEAVKGWGEWGIGFSYLWEGQVKLAQESLTEPSRCVDEAIGRRNGVSAMLASALAMALWELGDADAAEDVLLDRLDVLERVSAPEAIVMGYQVAARLACLNGQQRRALDLLDNLFALGEVRGMPRYCVASLFEQVRMHMLDGRMRSCAEVCDRLTLLASDLDRKSLLGRPLLLRVTLARGYSAIASEDWEAALTILEPLLAEADMLRRGREGCEARFLLALARMHCGLEWKADRDEVVGLAEIYGTRRSLQELQVLAGTWGGDESAEERIRRQEPTTPAVRAHAPAAIVRTGGLLTSKEEEILVLLGRNLSNKRIASAMGISDETVKWHLKHLFMKFNAGSRRHVVDRARMLGILGDEH